MVGERQLIGIINDIVFYTVLYDSADILRRRSLGSNVIERVNLIRDKTKDHTCRYFKMMRKGVNPVFYTWVVIEHIAVKVAKLECIPL